MVFMRKPIRLYFNNFNSDWELIYPSLEVLFPGIVWGNGLSLDSFHPFMGNQNYMLHIQFYKRPNLITNNNDMKLDEHIVDVTWSASKERFSNSDKDLYNDGEGRKYEVYDGNEYLGLNTNTEDMFNQIYENIIKKVLREEKEWFEKIEPPKGETIYNFLNPILRPQDFIIIRNRYRGALRYKIYPKKFGADDYLVLLDEEEFNIENIKKQIEYKIKFHEYWRDFGQKKYHEEMVDISKNLNTLIPD